MEINGLGTLLRMWDLETAHRDTFRITFKNVYFMMILFTAYTLNHSQAISSNGKYLAI